jgi:hypothetical protein
VGKDLFGTQSVCYRWFVPRKPRHWLYLADALASVERLEVVWVDRATLQESLGCSQTEAWRILKRLGAEAGPGGALVLAKDVFLERVRSYLADDRVTFEQRRRERLEQALDALNPHTRSRLVKVIAEDRPADALDLISTRLASLPPGVTLTPRSLHIEFGGREEFLARLGAVVFALENDTDRILELIGTGAPGE